MLGVLGLLVMNEPDLASTIVLALIALLAARRGGVRRHHLADARHRGRAAHDRRSRSRRRTAGRACSRSCTRGSDQANTGYQLSQSLIAIGSGGVNGVGLGAGRAKWFFLPNAHTDFIFAIIGEELGFIGCLLVLGLFAGFGLVGFRVARRAPDRVRHAHRGRRHRVDRRPGRDQPRRGRRPAAGLGRPAAVPVGRRLVARHHDVRRRHRREHRAPDRRRSRSRRRAPDAGARPGLVSAPVFALLTGGGTGGHTYPAIAVAQELVRRGHPRESCGSSAAAAGIEGRVVPDAGFEIDLLPAAGCNAASRSRTSRRSWARSSAFVHALALVRRYRPRVVVGFGGYASLPCVAAARLLRVPTWCTSRTRRPVSRTASASASGARAAVSLPDTPLPGATLTGNPVRAAFAALERKPRGATPRCSRSSAARRAPARSTGPRSAATTRWRDRRDLAVHHVCGPRNLDECRAALDGATARPATRSCTSSCGYEAHMESLLARATLAVCRAGAGTIAELTVAGLPAVLVPLPGPPSDHQTRNAQTLEQAGAAVMRARRRVRPGPARRRRVGAPRARPTGSRRWAPRRARSAGPTPRPDSPISSRSTRVPDAAGDPRRTEPTLDLGVPRRVHIVGVGGAG